MLAGGPRRRNTVLFLMSLLLSFTIWFIHIMSQEYSDLVTVNVWAESNIEGHTSRSSESVPVVARCTATGFRHIGLAKGKREVVVNIDKSDFVRSEACFYTVSGASLGKYASAIFTDQVRPESFITPSVTFRFPEQNNRKVPVQAVTTFSYRPQYMSGGPVVLSPDSVVVYGDPRLTAGIDKVLTRQIVRKDLHGGVHGVVRLEAPSGVRLSEQEVIYSMDVCRFVELRTKLQVGTRNVPSGQRLSVLPSSAEVTFRCVFPLISNPEDRFELFIDYEDFAASKSGHCLARYDELPDGVISLEIRPEVFGCVETQ